MLYLGDKKATLFKGDRRPVSLYLGDKKVTGYEYAEQTGEHLDFEGTYNDTASVVINGKSEQVQTVQGKNLLDINQYYSDYINDGVLTYTNADFGKIHAINIDCGFETGVQYTFSCEYHLTSTDTEDSNGIGIAFLDEHLASLKTRWIEVPALGSVSGSTTLVNDAGTTIKYIRLTYATSSRDCSVELSNIQLELGSTATEYEPFVPNSPSPEYPSPIKSVGDDGGFDLVSSGKNLFDTTKFPVTQTQNGVTVSRENDIITIDGTNIGNARFYSAYFYLPFGNIRLSFRVIGGTFNNSVRVYLYQTDYYIDGVVLLSGTTGSKTINISPSGNYRLAVYSQNGYSYNNCKIQIQLEFGSVTTPYTPFRGMSVVNYPYTLRGLPDGTKDYIEIDNVQKRAWWQPLTELYAFNGDESIAYYATANNNNPNNDGFRFNRPNTDINITNRNFTCTHFDYAGNASLTTNIGIGLSSTVGAFYFIINRYLTGITDDDNDSTRVAKFKAWLAAEMAAGRQVKLSYKLANPPEPIELDYNEIKTFYPQTQIYTTATVQPTLEAKIRTWGAA